MNTTVTRVRLERLLDSRATISKLHEDLLAVAEARGPEANELSDVEKQQAANYRTKAAELDSEIEELNGVLEREDASADTSKKVRSHLAGHAPGVEIVDGEPTYTTFGAFARDALITGAPNRGDVQLARSANVLNNIRNAAGGEQARQAAMERLSRTPDHTLSSDLPGIQPPQYLAQILDVINSTRPVITSGARVNLTRGVIQFPKITQRPDVQYQGTVEKQEGGTQKMVIGMSSGTADTFIGGGNLSWQAMEWSTPDALDLWFRLAGEQYAIQTEGTACSVLEAAATTGTVSAPLVGGTADTYNKWLAAVLAGAGTVFGASRAMADTIWLSPDMFFEAAGLTATGGAQLISAGNLNVAGLSGTLAGLRVVVSAGFSPKTAIVGDSRALLVAENAGAPVQLRAVEPAIGGLEVGIIGAFKAVAFDDTRFSTLT